MPQAGQGRRLYPGFVQLSAFMSMNPEWHKKQFQDMYRYIVEDQIDKTETIRISDLRSKEGQARVSWLHGRLRRESSHRADDSGR